MHLNYREYGQGDPIVILHGLLGMLDNWQSFAKKLAQDYWVINVDLRNHGKSFHHEKHDYVSMAEDIIGLLDKLHIPQTNILGHSMGGKVVLESLAQFDNYINKAIVVDISPKSYGGGHEKIFESLLSIDLSIIKDRNEVKDILMSKLNDLSVVLFLMKNLKRLPLTSDKPGYEWKANISGLFNNYKDILDDITFDQKISNDVLFVKGGLSNYIKNDDLEWLKHFDSAIVEEISQAGHWVHADQPEALLTTVKEFLHS